MKETYICCICDSEFEKEDIKHIEIEGNVKNICKECITSVKGLL
jgi:hypothetical protein